MNDSNAKSPFDVKLGEMLEAILAHHGAEFDPSQILIEKLWYAKYLADFGLYQLSGKYVDILHGLIKSDSDLLSGEFVKAFQEFKDRMNVIFKKAPINAAGQSGWLTQIGSNFTGAAFGRGIESLMNSAVGVEEQPAEIAGVKSPPSLYPVPSSEPHIETSPLVGVEVDSYNPTSYNIDGSANAQVSVHDAYNQGYQQMNPSDYNHRNIQQPYQGGTAQHFENYGGGQLSHNETGHDNQYQVEYDTNNIDSNNPQMDSQYWDNSAGQADPIYDVNYQYSNQLQYGSDEIQHDQHQREYTQHENNFETNAFDPNGYENTTYQQQEEYQQYDYGQTDNYQQQYEQYPSDSVLNNQYSTEQADFYAANPYVPQVYDGQYDTQTVNEVEQLPNKIENEQMQAKSYMQNSETPQIPSIPEPQIAPVTEDKLDAISKSNHLIEDDLGFGNSKLPKVDPVEASKDDKTAKSDTKSTTHALSAGNDQTCNDIII